jgi:hypothetical protein
LLRLLHRQQAQQNLIEQRKNRGVGPNPKRQGQYRHRGEHGTLRQNARGITDISNQNAHKQHLPGAKVFS